MFFNQNIYGSFNIRNTIYLCIFIVWINLCRYNIILSIDDNILNKPVLIKIIFYHLRRNIFSIAKYYKIFLSAI